MSNSVTSRFSLFRCLLTNVINVCGENAQLKLALADTQQGISVKDSEDVREAFAAAPAYCTFFTTFSLSGAWSNRVSKASRSVGGKTHTVTRRQRVRVRLRALG